jgi:hypothetical protein
MCSVVIYWFKKKEWWYDRMMRDVEGYVMLIWGFKIKECCGATGRLLEKKGDELG